LPPIFVLKFKVITLYECNVIKMEKKHKEYCMEDKKAMEIREVD